jgi:transposase-like protein
MAKAAEFSTLYELFEAIPDEAAALAHFRAVRWKGGAFCPYCGSVRIYDIKGGTKGRARHKCGDCRLSFSIKVGTIFEDTKIPMRKWLAAVWLITSHKKGIASTQLARDIGVTQKTAWFMLHRLRHAARTRSFNRPLNGEVEVDETFIGGKMGNRPLKERIAFKEAGIYRTGPKHKAVVMGLLERGGELRAGVVAGTSQDDLEVVVRAHVAEGATVYTDEHRGYRDLTHGYDHQTVAHRAKEYARGEVHTNSLEGFWSLLKRQIYGIHHWVSVKHLDQYVAEAAWRYMLRGKADGQRVTTLLAQTAGRLTYADLIGRAGA